MSTSIRTLLHRLAYRDGVNPAMLGIAGLSATLLLALFVQTLHVSVARGDALRAQQQAAQHGPLATNVGRPESTTRASR